MDKRLAITVPFEDFKLGELPELCREAEALGYREAWSYENDGTDIFSPLAVPALTTGMRLVTAIANVYTRGPQTLASSAVGMDELAPGRFVLGLGAGSRNIIEDWNGGAFVNPLKRMREVVTAVRGMLAGERVVMDGETLRLNGVRLSRLPARPVPIYLAALRPKMLALAGEIGDGVILNAVPVQDIPRVVSVVRDAARAAGRDPGEVEISAQLLVSVDDPGPEAEVGLRRMATGYFGGVPTYRAHQIWLGRGEEIRPMLDAWDAGDRKGALAAVPETLLRDIFISGTPAERRAHVQRHLDAGVDIGFFKFLSSDPDRQRRRMKVLQAMRELAPTGHPAGSTNDAHRSIS